MEVRSVDLRSKTLILRKHQHKPWRTWIALSTLSDSYKCYQWLQTLSLHLYKTCQRHRTPSVSPEQHLSSPEPCCITSSYSVLWLNFRCNEIRGVAAVPHATQSTHTNHIRRCCRAPHMTAFTSSVSSVCQWPVVTARRERMLNVSSTCTNTQTVRHGHTTWISRRTTLSKSRYLWG